MTIEDLKDLAIPKEVLDENAYKEWYILSKHNLLNDKAFVNTADGNKVSLHKLPHHLKKDIEHLDLKEQTKVMLLKQQYNKIFTQANVWKRRAFGTSTPKGHSLMGALNDRKEDVLELLGRMFSAEEVTKIINDEWKIPIAVGTVYNFKKANIDEITRRVDKHKASFSDLRLGIKRSRLEELIWLYNKRKDKYKQTENKDDYKLLLTTLEQIRKESEGEQISINGKLTLAYESEIQSHLQQEVFKSFNLKEIILARVAARSGVSVPKLIASLNNSYYNKYSGVVHEIEDVPYEPVFPSTQNYNFDKMESMVEQNLAKEQPKAETPKDELKAKTLKELLAEKLAKKQADLRTQRGLNDTEADERESKVKKKKK